jgi:N-acetylglutamate synthase-like GNAT family acetyltransferase
MDYPSGGLASGAQPARHKHSDARSLQIRAPHASEVRAIVALFEDEVRAGRMLPRSPHEIQARLGDWRVACDGERIVGCASLVFFNAELCEVRSLAVDPAYRRNGLGGALIAAMIDLACQRGMRRVLTLTRATPIFERAGFRRELVANFPEKVWRDCAPCPLRERCDEIALIYHLDRQEETE